MRKVSRSVGKITRCDSEKETIRKFPKVDATNYLNCNNVPSLPIATKSDCSSIERELFDKNAVHVDRIKVLKQYNQKVDELHQNLEDEISKMLVFEGNSGEIEKEYEKMLISTAPESFPKKIKPSEKKQQLNQLFIMF